MRLGELLIADGLVLPAHVERVLAAQARRGVRIGSLLVEAELVTADAVARALGRQHTTPAALERHLGARDVELGALIPGELARAHVAIPLARSRDGGVVVAMRDPRDTQAIAALERVLGHRVVPAVACEVVLRRLVDRVYPAPVEEVDVDMDSGPMPVIRDAPPPRDHEHELELGDIELGPPTDILDPATVRAQPAQVQTLSPDAFDPETIRVGALVSLDDAHVDRDHRATDIPHGARRSGSFAAALPQAPAPPAGAVAPALSTRPPLRPTPLPQPAVAAPASDLAATVARIATAPTRDAILAAVVDHGRAGLDALVVLAVRQGMVFGDTGFAPELGQVGIEAITLPLSLPSVLKTCVDTARAFSGRPPISGSAIQDRLLKLLGKPPGLVVVPITVASRVVNLLVAGCRSVDDTAAAATALTAIAGACAAALARLRA